MKYILSRYNHDVSWVKEYTDDVVMYDRSEEPLPNSIVVPNIGSDIYDKFTYIIDNYDNLPEVALYSKANLFKYITKEEFDKVKDNTTFTPLLSMNHPEVMCDQGLLDWYEVKSKKFSYYEDGMYYELNFPSYMKAHPFKDQPVLPTLDWYHEHPLTKLLQLDKIEYIPFAPGSNYIVPKENILQYPKDFYKLLRSYLEWTVYPGEAMLLERSLYRLWK